MSRRRRDHDRALRLAQLHVAGIELVRPDADDRDDEDRAALHEPLRLSIEQMNNGQLIEATKRSRSYGPSMRFRLSPRALSDPRDCRSIGNRPDSREVFDNGARDLATWVVTCAT
jgi:hypothetical protein